MGIFMKENDIFVGSLLDELNLRFAPSQGKASHYGGIEELAALQKEFQIFKKGRSFKTSVSVLSLSAWNNDAKNRWHNYLDSLAKLKSNRAALSGDAAIIDALLKNFAQKKPLPVYFVCHDMRPPNGTTSVLITDSARPLFYLKQDYLTISLPFKSATPSPAKAPAKKAKN